MANGHTNERKAEILAAAQRVFEAHGYTATTMDAVATEACISKGSIYNYFQNKQDLFYQVFNSAVATSLTQSIALLDQNMPAARKLDLMLDLWHQQLDYYLRISRLVLEYWATAAREQQGELAANFKQTYGYWRRQLAELISAGIASGEFSGQYEVPLAASLIMAVLDGILVQSMLGMGLCVDQQFVDGLKHAIRVALSARQSSVVSNEVASHEQK